MILLVSKVMEIVQKQKPSVLLVHNLTVLMRESHALLRSVVQVYVTVDVKCCYLDMSY